MQNDRDREHQVFIAKAKGTCLRMSISRFGLKTRRITNATGDDRLTQVDTQAPDTVGLFYMRSALHLPFVA